MNRTELATLIDNGESSGVEFKRDDITPQSLAREMAALLNLEGGHILLGVEDDGSVSGLTREAKKTEAWVMEAARTHLRPSAIPFWETLLWGSSETAGVASLPADAPDKPYKYRRGSSWVTQTRARTTSRDATDEEEARLYMQSGRLPYDRKPVPGAGLEDLDMRRLVNYFRDMRRQPCPLPTTTTRGRACWSTPNSCTWIADARCQVRADCCCWVRGLRSTCLSRASARPPTRGRKRTTPPGPGQRCEAPWSHCTRSPTPSSSRFNRSRQPPSRKPTTRSKQGSSPRRWISYAAISRSTPR